MSTPLIRGSRRYLFILFDGVRDFLLGTRLHSVAEGVQFVEESLLVLVIGRFHSATSRSSSHPVRESTRSYRWKNGRTH